MAEIETMIIGPPKTDRDDDDTGVSKSGVGGKKSRGGSGVVDRRVISLSDDDDDNEQHNLDEDAEEGEAELVVNRPRVGDDDDDDNEVSVNDDVYQLFLAYKNDRQLGGSLYAGDVYAKLHEIYESYTTEEKIIYAKKNFLPQLMSKLRNNVNKEPDTGEWNLQFLLRTQDVKGSIKLLTTFNMSTTLTMRERLITEPNILLYSFNDLVCLAYTLKYQKESLKLARDLDAATKLIGVVERQIQKTINEKLRPLDGSMAALKATNLLFAGEPIGLAVEKFVKILQNYGDRNDRGHVAVYFDFEKTKLYTINAKDVEVPTVVALDAAYNEMRQHPRKLVLLDLRKQYKTRRGWM